MIIRWLSGANNNELKQLHLGILIVFSSVIGGYMITNFPRKFLKLFTTPIGQFVAFMIFNTIIELNQSDFNICHVIIESIFAVIILQVFKIIIFKIFDEDNQ